jgi:hypothetical protein
MARARKPNLAARIRQKRLTSAPPPPDEEVVVRVAPLTPPPDLAPPAARVEAIDVTSLAPVARTSVAAPTAPAPADEVPAGVPVSSPSRWGVVVGALAVAAGVLIGARLMRRPHPPAAAPVAAVTQAAPPAEPVPPPPPIEPAAPPAPASATAAAGEGEAPAASAANSAAPPPTAAPQATNAVAAAAPAPSSAADTPAPVAAPTSAPSAAPAAAPDEKVASARALREESLELLKKSKNREAMVKATAAMEADPTDAMPYLVLGSALQDAGRWREARGAYELCVKNASPRGMVEECHAMLRRR